MKAINEIKKEFDAIKGSVNTQELELFIHEYEKDERAGVKKLIISAGRHLNVLHEEINRMDNMKQYERQYEMCRYIAGIDEVGRGPLAGPVVTCAVILPKDCDLLFINDSKKVPKKRRELLSERIKECAIACELGVVEPDVIDEINILNATYKAMKEAVEHLSVKPDILLVDAVKIPNLSVKQVPIIKGDAKSISIAAASIVAKVARDSIMEEYDSIYPEYGFAQNVGYGVEKHIDALKKYGPCPIHRKSFIKNFVS